MSLSNFLNPDDENIEVEAAEPHDTINQALNSLKCLLSLRSMTQTPTPWSSRYSCAWKEASSSRQRLKKVKEH
ncbi:BgTH12-06872 [Blumeria graminis f. sp. triticale]|uniref:Bgt-20680 n=3 Tax=Blumeria graminis TaxID=34373 RepID=A0A381LBR3_BLUGR|nr:BgTH12-06872 [Blumeria graminis f. sp. triticale]VDB94540.1 Bgt-20680 [Blumeria graminis f. sp. tritici]